MTKALERVCATGNDGVGPPVEDAMHMIRRAAVSRGSAPDPGLRYFRAARGGGVHACKADAPLPSGWQYQIDGGHLAELTEDQKAAYLAGEDFE